jgi:hypothetical protein
VGVKLRFRLILKEEHRQRVFKNRVMKEIFGAEEDVSGGWKKCLIYFTPYRIILG